MKTRAAVAHSAGAPLSIETIDIKGPRYMERKIEIDPLITRTLGVDRINEGLDLMHAGKSIRSVVVY